MAIDRNYFLYRSLSQHSWRSLLLKLLCCLTSRSWRVCELFSITCSTLRRILLSTGFREIQPTFQICLFGLLVSLALPQQIAAKNSSLGITHSLFQHTYLQHLMSHIKRPKLPQEVESPLSFPVDRRLSPQLLLPK